ncbi:MAG: archaemetzincin family Zn-dependent metalloprotease [Desulfobacterales bacterium]|jgi:archaemetzincin
MIGVLPIGKVPPLVPKVAAAHISGYLNVPAQCLAPLPLPESAWDRRRLQYDAGRLLKALEPMAFEGCRKVIGMLAVDLFVPIFSHVFGEARQGGNLALVSTFRLRQDPQESEPSPLTLARSAKVTLHELGHLFNLHHCQDPECLMHFSGSVADLDQPEIFFCRYCAQYFRDTLQRRPSQAAG